MKRALCFLLFLCLTGFVMAQHAEAVKDAEKMRSPEALEILNKVDAAIKAVHSVRCQVAMRPSGAAENFFAAGEGTSVMVGWNGAMPDKFYTHVKTKDQESGKVVELTGGGNGDTYFLIDHQAKKGYEDMDPAVMGSAARALRGVGMIEFIHDTPFDDELNADVVELQAEEVVDGEACYRIHVAYAAGQGESTWFFSKKDYLPRRRIRQFSTPDQGEGAFEIDVSRLEINIEPDENLFRMKLPEGYEQIDDFAP
jgi:outer membrane lipoprotein-sorting protein